MAIYFPELKEERKAIEHRSAVAAIDDYDVIDGDLYRSPTLYTWTLLQVADNGLVKGRYPLYEDVRDYLWCHHLDFDSGKLLCDFKARDKFYKNFGKRTGFGVGEWSYMLGKCYEAYGYWFFRPWREPDCYEEIVEEVVKCIDYAWMDAPIGDPSDEVSVFSARMQHFFYKHYGWDIERTLHAPLKRLWPLYKEVLTDAGQKTMTGKETSLYKAFLDGSLPSRKAFADRAVNNGGGN